MLRAITDLVFPRACVSCGAPADWLCASCDATFPWLRACCARCALPTVIPIEECASCRAHSPPYTRVRAAALYAGCARDALIAFKVRGERRAARAMAARMVTVAPRADLVTFVPATRRSRSDRGFEPARELARHVARELDVRCVRLLRKTRETKDQAGLSRTSRKDNVAGAFEALAVQKDAEILLVDDVMTTGATVGACAQALRLDGMGQIAILTFARAG